jgi:hypothetical protein
LRLARTDRVYAKVGETFRAYARFQRGDVRSCEVRRIANRKDSGKLRLQGETLNVACKIGVLDVSACLEQAGHPSQHLFVGAHFRGDLQSELADEIAQVLARGKLVHVPLIQKQPRHTQSAYAENRQGDPVMQNLPYH